MNFRARQLRFTETCTVKRSAGSGGQYGAPATVATAVPCSPVFDYEETEHERGGLATVVRRTQLFVKRPATGIEDGDVVELSGETFTVNKVIPIPHRSNVQFYQLVVELAD